MPIKILVISNYNDRVTARPEAEWFIALKKTGFDVEVMTKGDTYYAGRFREEGIRVIDYKPPSKYSREAIHRIRQELKNGGHQIMHLFNNPAIINGIFAAWSMPVKICLYRGYTGNINWWNPLDYLKFLSPRVDKIFCLAQSIEELLHRQLFFKKSKAVTVNKGHRVEWYEGTRPLDIHKEFGIPKGAFVGVNVANTRRMKGIKYLAQATHDLKKEDNIYLLMVGRGLDTPEVKKIMATSPIKDNVIFTGFRTDALSIVKACDTFVNSSIKGEATTKAIIEAMCLETAPIITDIPGNRNLVLHEKQGIVVPKANPKALAAALLKMKSDPEKCRFYGKAAKQQIAENFSVERTVANATKVYKDLLKD